MALLGAFALTFNILKDDPRFSVCLDSKTRGVNTLFEFFDSQPLSLSYPHQEYSVSVSQALLRKGVPSNYSILVLCDFVVAGGRDKVAWHANSEAKLADSSEPGRD